MTNDVDSLETIEQAAWARLAAATKDPKSAYRNVTVATVDQAGHPQCRLVVLREVDVDGRTLDFHTDTRSPKWGEMEDNTHISVLGYDPAERLQLRLDGVASLHGPEAPLNSLIWQQLSTWPRSTYCGGPPGDTLAFPEPTGVFRNSPTEQETEVGRDRFGVVRFTVNRLDWFQHQRGNLRRAMFKYSGGIGLQTAKWIAP